MGVKECQVGCLIQVSFKTPGKKEVGLQVLLCAGGISCHRFLRLRAYLVHFNFGDQMECRFSVGPVLRYYDAIFFLLKSESGNSSYN